MAATLVSVAIANTATQPQPDPSATPADGRNPTCMDAEEPGGPSGDLEHDERVHEHPGKRHERSRSHQRGDFVVFISVDSSVVVD